MSLEYYQNVKIARGDAQGQTNGYNLDRFTCENDIFNDLLDCELSNKK